MKTKPAKPKPGVFQPRYTVKVKNHTTCTPLCRLLVDTTDHRESRQSHTWFIRYGVDGRMVVESAKSTSQRDAEKLLAQRRASLSQGNYLGPQVNKTTFEDLATLITNDYKVNGRRPRRLLFALSNLRKAFGLDRASHITADRILAYTAKRLECPNCSHPVETHDASHRFSGAAPATVNRELAALRRMFALGVKAGKVGRIPSIDRLRENNTRKGFFSESEMRSVVSHLPGYLQGLIETAYWTGWRTKSEIVNRQWKHVELKDKDGWLRLEPGEGKSKEGRMFPLIPQLRAILDRQRAYTNKINAKTGRIVPWVFHRNGHPIKDYKNAWRAACKKAGLAGRIPHDFRRTAVRNLERAGVARSAAMKMIGHKTEAVYRRYAIVDSEMLKEAGAKLAASVTAPATVTVLPRAAE